MMHQKQEKSLVGKTILVTRQHEQAGELVAAIEANGGRACVIPMLRIVDPERWDLCDVAIGQLSVFNGLLITSSNAAEKFIQRLDAKGIERKSFESIEVFAVGQRTADVLRALGLRIAFTPPQFSAAGLRKHFEAEQIVGKRFLFPRGNLSREELPASLRSLGAMVDEVEVYRNVPPTSEELDALRVRFLNGEFDVVTFASPSAVNSFRQAIPPNIFGSGHPLVAVIGPTTSAAAKELGFPVNIEATEATSNGLVDAIAAFYSQK
jgi:uroporphyrinogen III methyltransferase / synthase